MTFSEKKFLSLPLRKRHKQAGEYLRLLFERNLPLDAYYRQLEKWLKLSPIEETNEALTDRFHFHMREASIACSEQALLVKQIDSLSSLPYLPLTIYLENLRSAFNIGSILRTVEAFRLGTVVFSENTPNAQHPKVQKTAMGVAPIVPSRQGGLASLPSALS